jgi:hypothetical protein
MREATTLRAVPRSPVFTPPSRTHPCDDACALFAVHPLCHAMATAVCAQAAVAEAKRAAEEAARAAVAAEAARAAALRAEQEEEARQVGPRFDPRSCSRLSFLSSRCTLAVSFGVIKGACRVSFAVGSRGRCRFLFSQKAQQEEEARQVGRWFKSRCRRPFFLFRAVT